MVCASAHPLSKRVTSVAALASRTCLFIDLSNACATGMSVAEEH
jgi:hypothetical protein